MAKDTAITVRVPLELKRRLEQRARRERRSISAQVQLELELAFAQQIPEPAERCPIVGLFKGARVPSDEDFLAVRAALWGGLGRRDG